MAFYKVNESFLHAVDAASDLSAAANLNLFIAINSDGKAAVCGSGAKVFGTSYELPLAADKPMTIQFAGIAKVKAGAAVAAGAEVQSDGSGKAITLAAGKRAGIALAAAGAANVVIPVALMA